ncbi:outer membrane protein TolC [Pseudoduganella lurida]|uniref:Outer membrane protein TolC n=1 Tax=Pseudoduganella lurida TaxID=1036180 RepID=A0A562RKG8_9BURK|nr:TolC family protein [Pseudoduganella lurida]TWI69545.1 outer membrane protein TolC [Pseudoduganella lurida]
MKSTMMAAACALLLGGCATFSSDGGMNAVDSATQARAGAPARLLRNDGDRRALADQLRPLLAKPLSADDAVRIALLNNRGLQATYWELGIAEADLVQAGRLQNPAFGYQHEQGGGAKTIERSLTFNVVSLLTAPLAARIEGRLFAATQLRVTEEALRVAADTRRAYYEAVGGAQAVDYAKTVSAAADASADLASRMRKAGNWSQYDEAREQAFHAEALAAAGRATQGAVAARERLARLLGLDEAFQLPDRLPDLPATPRELADVDKAALRDRLDVQAAQEDTARVAALLGLARTTRFINVLELGAMRESSPGEPQQRGYAVTLEIPLFDWGTARTRRAEAVYMQSVNRLAETATQARSEAREAYAAYRASFELAKHYRDVVIPLRKRVSDETLLRYNGMLLSTFELLADAREQTVAVAAAIEAQKDYWIAAATLDAALGGRTATTEPGAHP